MLIWVYSYMAFQYFSWNLTHWYFIFIFCPHLRYQSWMCNHFGGNSGMYRLNLCQKVFLKYEDSFSIPLLWKLSKSASILSIITWKVPASSWSTSEPAIFSKTIPSLLGRLENFKIPWRFLCRRPAYPYYFSVSYNYVVTIKEYLTSWGQFPGSIVLYNLTKYVFSGSTSVMRFANQAHSF